MARPQTLVDMFVAGTNTVSTALEWMLLLLAAEPLEQERARAATTRGGAAASSAYVDALLSEVLRYKSPLLLPRTATRDARVGGYDVPRGTVVLANNHALTSSARWYFLLAASHLPTTYWYLPPPTSHLRPPTSFLLPPSSFLLPPFSFLGFRV